MDSTIMNSILWLGAGGLLVTYMMRRKKRRVSR